MICSWILSPVVTVIKTLVTVARTIVETVCEWVSSVITVVENILREVCEFRWWNPLSWFCFWVPAVVTVVKTVWDWVCHNVITTIFDIIEVIVTIVEYILKWVCWLVDWIVFRWIDYLLCRIGFEPKRCLHVCIKILTDAKSTPAATSAQVDAAVAQAQSILSNCNIDIRVTTKTFVEKAEFLDSTSCGFGGMFSSFYQWFSWNTCRCCNIVTVYFVRSMTNAGGCAYPGSDFVIVANDRSPAGMGNTMVQEIGHLCDLWAHSSDPNNVMTDQPGGTSDQITEHQCCIIRSSRFVGACPKRG